MFPIGDENPTRRRPIFTWLFLAVNIVVFLWEFTITSGFLDERAVIQLFLQYGAIPLSITDALTRVDTSGLSTLLSSMFLHGGLIHIAGNMLYLYVFGDNVEDRFGHLGFLISYLIWGIAAGLTHSYVSVMSEDITACTQTLIGRTASCTPAVGASGAISGVLGAYLAIFPRARIRTIILSLYLLGRVISIPAYYYLVFWFILQLFYGAIGELAGGVAYWAHIGGFIIGFLFGLAYRLTTRRNPWS